MLWKIPPSRARIYFPNSVVATTDRAPVPTSGSSGGFRRDGCQRQTFGLLPCCTEAAELLRVVRGGGISRDVLQDFAGTACTPRLHRVIIFRGAVGPSVPETRKPRAQNSTRSLQKMTYEAELAYTDPRSHATTAQHEARGWLRTQQDPRHTHPMAPCAVSSHH